MKQPTFFGFGKKKDKPVEEVKSPIEPAVEVPVASVKSNIVVETPKPPEVPVSNNVNQHSF